MSASSGGLTLAAPTAALEDALEAFVRAHPFHSSGHRRFFATLERRIGHREVSVVALLEGQIVGYAPAFVVPRRRLRAVAVPVVTGGSLVSAGPLVDQALGEKARHEVLAAMVEALRRAVTSEGAHWLRWVLSPMSGHRSTLVAERPHPLLPLGFTMRQIPGPVLSLAHSPETLLAGMGATTRHAIRKAERSGLRVVHSANSPEAASLLETFRGSAGLSFGGMTEANAAFDAVLECVRDEAPRPDALLHAVVVRQDDEPLGAVVTSESNGCAYYFLAFNTPKGLRADANRAGLWAAVQASQGRGARWFQMGSLDFGSDKSGRISAFKQQFGGTIVSSPVFEWCARPLADSVVRLAESMIGSGRRYASSLTARRGDRARSAR
jgi:hypothetical protein